MDPFDLFGGNGTEEMERQMDLPGLDPPNTGDFMAKRAKDILYFLQEDIMKRYRKKYPRLSLS